MLANIAAHGGGSSGGGGHNGGGHTGNPNNPYKDHQCQVYDKFGHTTLHCWKCSNKNYSGLEKTTNVATTSSSNNLDPVGYADTVATNHITSDLDKLMMTENYAGPDQVHAANGVGMMIKHIGHSIVPTHCRQIFLKNVLHVPQAT
jgi:hypothetical protein